MKSKLETMTLFKLNELLTILMSVKKRLCENITCNNPQFLDESVLSSEQKDMLNRYNTIQSVINDVELMIEKKIFSDYVK